MTEEAAATPPDWPGETLARAPAADVNAARAEESVASSMTREVNAGSAVKDCR